MGHNMCQYWQNCKHLGNYFRSEVTNELPLLLYAVCVLDSTDKLLLNKVLSDLFLSSGFESSTLPLANLHFSISIH